MKDKRTQTENKPIVQTVKLDTALYVRLKTYGAKTRRTNQDILLAALTDYLNKVKA
jgi:hypothetical protein